MAAAAAATTSAGGAPVAAVASLPSQSSFGSTAPSGAPHRSLIPFGVNRPFAAALPRHTSLGTFADALPDTDSDLDDDLREGAAGGRPSASGTAGTRAPNGVVRQRTLSGTSAMHMQRQLSSGGAGAASGIGPFGRAPTRKGSLFGKVYALNVGDQPLLRLLLQVSAGTFICARACSQGAGSGRATRMQKRQLNRRTGYFLLRGKRRHPAHKGSCHSALA